MRDGDSRAKTGYDVLVVGAGAAGLATAIFAARRAPQLGVAVVDGARVLGAKILVSGGGRCNVTNRVVGEADFWGGSRTAIRRILRAFTAEQAVAFFHELGVALHEEERGKLFPDTNRARTVLEALLSEARGRGVRIRPECRVTAVARDPAGFRLETSQGPVEAARIALATGGLSLPKTGSDGGGYRLARSLGHSLVTTTPGLVPLVLDGDFHAPLSGVAHEAELIVRAAGAKAITLRGPMLWTHFGVSGPAALDASRHWLRARALGLEPTVELRFVPGADASEIDRRLLVLARERPRLALRGALASWLPAAVGAAVAAQLGLADDTPLGRLSRDERKRLARALGGWALPVRDSRGYAFAEVTAGGVPLSEIDPGTMESRLCPGLHLVGEILDVDGRLGGFNFQWAWSTGWVAGRSLGSLRT